MLPEMFSAWHFFNLNIKGPSFQREPKEIFLRLSCAIVVLLYFF